MSERMFNTAKVEEYIGLPGKKSYDRIELFKDIANPNNIWGMVYYTDYSKRKPVTKSTLVRFYNNFEMMEYLNKYFDCYELNHPVDVRNKKIFFHFVTYQSDLLDDKSNKKYFVLNYFEHSNGPIVSRSIPFPREYKNFFQDVIRVSKGMAPYQRLRSSISRDSELFGEKSQMGNTFVSKYTTTFGEKLYQTGAKLKNVKKDYRVKDNIVRKLKIFVSVAALATLLAGGYTLVTHHVYNSEYVSQVNAVTNLKDMDLFLHKADYGVKINALMEGRYDEVSPEELADTLEFIRKLDNANYDKNGSFNSFNYDEYFSYKLVGQENYADSIALLKKIENLYKDSFYVSDNEVHIIEDGAYQYIDFVSSLAFMYDSYHENSDGSFLKNINSRNPFSKRATTAEISTYDRFPEILKYTILTQLKGMMSKVDFKVKEKPLYYFKDLSKDNLILEVSKRKDAVEDQLYFNCGVNYRHNGL